MEISRFFRSLDELRAQQEPDEPKVMDSLLYVLKNDTCPLCGSDDIDFGPFDPENGAVFRPCTCNICETEWVEHYVLAGLEGDEKHRTALPFNHTGIKGIVSSGDDGLILYIDGRRPINLLELAEKSKP